MRTLFSVNTKDVNMFKMFKHYVISLAFYAFVTIFILQLIGCAKAIVYAQELTSLKYQIRNIDLLLL